jgi:hypothetical protein
MTGNCRFLLAALFLSLAERDAANVKVKNREPRRTARLKNRIAEQAREFVASEGFDEWCEQLHLTPSVLRRLDPSRANIGYLRIVANQLRED